MTTYYSAILCEYREPFIIAPPMNTDIFNFAPVELNKKMATYVDENAPLKDVPIPVGTRWVYAVYNIVETGDLDYPLQAGLLMAGPYVDRRDAEKIAQYGQLMGNFVCIFCALIVGDRSKLN